MEVTKVARLLVSMPDADHANAERNQQLFDWALAVLKRLGIEQAIRRATSIEGLRRIALNLDGAEIALAIRDALHPASGDRAKHFRGLREGSLKRILRNRFDDLKKDREKELKQRRGNQQHHWSDDLETNKNGSITPILANLILILRCNDQWKGVLGFDKFAQRVMTRKSPPLAGDEEPDAPWTDHHESLTRVWFQTQVKINPTTRRCRTGRAGGGSIQRVSPSSGVPRLTCVGRHAAS
jgi:hypothetical protein